MKIKTIHKCAKFLSESVTSSKYRGHCTMIKAINMISWIQNNFAPILKLLGAIQEYVRNCRMHFTTSMLSPRMHERHSSFLQRYSFDINAKWPSRLKTSGTRCLSICLRSPSLQEAIVSTTRRKLLSSLPVAHAKVRDLCRS